MQRPAFPPIISFLFPNVWRLRISDRFYNVIVLAPVDEGRLVFYVRTCQRMVTVPLLGRAFAWLSNVLNVYIAKEDYQAIRSQRPVRHQPGGAEHLIPADRPIALYLRRRQELAAGRALPAPMGRLLRVASVTRETEDAVSFVLRDPAGSPLAFEPGQFFTLLVPTPDGVLKRAYSATSAPGEHDGGVRLAAKHMKGGRSSGYLKQKLREGDTLQVLGPSGTFGPGPAAGPRHLLMIAGGSGITPMMGIARALLHREPQTRMSLVYGNRSGPDILFREELEALSRQYPGRLEVVHVLSEPPEGWKGRRGMLTAGVVGETIRALPLPDQVLLCGPEPMMRAATEALAAAGVDPQRVRRESFVQQQAGQPSLSREPQKITLRHGGVQRELTQAPGQTLLEAALAAGEGVPYSCGIGACGTCKARLVAGKVVQVAAGCLSEADQAAGYVLQCVCHATEAVVVEVPGPR
jgi:ferredoxin-NADP reductase